MKKSIGDILLEKKILTPDRLKYYIKKEKKSGETISTLLLDDGIITKRELTRLIISLSRQKELPDILLDLGYISRENLDSIYLSRGGEKRGIGKYLIKKGILSEEELMKGYATLYNLEFIDISKTKLDYELIKKSGQEILEKFRVIPIYEENGNLIIAISDPGNVIMIEELEKKLNKKIQLKVTTQSSIDLFLSTYFESKVKLGEFSKDMRIDDNKIEFDGVERVTLEDLKSEESQIIRMVNSIIYNAIERRASDIHFEVYEKEVKIKYRIDGVLFEALSEIDRGFMNLIVTRIKILSELDIAEHRVPQDGRFMLKIEERYVDFRVSILPTIYGETAVIRILDKLSMALEVDSIGFSDEHLKLFMDCIKRPYGMILVAGPTGSGKTTTLYSALKAIQNSEKKIITIEEPVEYQLSDIVQVPVNDKKGLTFSRGLRSIVRQDPDIIMVGEIRDLDTAQIAINAALTGHLVLSTIHSNNVIDSLTRLTNIGVNEHQFASSFNLIMAQRLVRKICNGCKIEEISEHPNFKGEKLWKGQGCKLCNDSGYFGRVAIFELLELTDEFREMILEKKSPVFIKRKAKEMGIKFLRDSAISKVKMGITTPDEIDRVTYIEKY